MQNQHALKHDLFLDINLWQRIERTANKLNYQLLTRMHFLD